LEEQVLRQTEQIHRAHEETIHRLVGASMYRDEETGAHIVRVGLSSALMAEALGWSADEVDRIRLAAPMHDVGKIGIPDAILQKPGKLTAEEFEIMKTHTTIGARLLDHSESPMLHMARDIALSHHERWDGSGYPRGLAGEAISTAARIVAIVDVYDALSHDRVYRPAMREEQVLDIVKEGRGTHFQPDLVDLLLSLLPQMKSIAAQNPDAKWDQVDAAAAKSSHSIPIPQLFVAATPAVTHSQSTL
jgi:putative two-component system response regulator